MRPSMAESALGGMTSNIANAGLSCAYVLLAQRFGTVPSLAAALAALGRDAAADARARSLVPGDDGRHYIAIYGGLHRLFRPYLAARPDRPPGRPWYLIPMRAGFVAVLAGTVTTGQRPCRTGLVRARWRPCRWFSAA